MTFLKPGACGHSTMIHLNQGVVALLVEKTMAKVKYLCYGHVPHYHTAQHCFAVMGHAPLVGDAYVSISLGHSSCAVTGASHVSDADLCSPFVSFLFPFFVLFFILDSDVCPSHLPFECSSTHWDGPVDLKVSSQKVDHMVDDYVHIRSHTESYPIY